MATKMAEPDQDPLNRIDIDFKKSIVTFRY